MQFCIIMMISSLPQAGQAADKQEKAARRAAILMQKMQQDMNAEKNALQTQMDEQKKTMEGQLRQAQSTQRKSAEQLQAQLRKAQQLQAEQQQLVQVRDGLAQKNQALNSELTSLQALNAELQRQFKQSQQALAEQVARSQDMKDVAARTDRQLLGCEEKNTRLYQYGHELVSLYDDASTYTKVMRQEPFFQLKRVELENILQKTKDNLDESAFNMSVK